MLRRQSLLLTVLACALTAPSSAAHVQSADAAKQFVGAWKLVSWTDRMLDGTTSANRHSVGSGIFSDSNRLCAMFMDPNRPKWAAPPVPTADEALTALTGSIGFCGTYRVHATDGTLEYRVDVADRPNTIGVDRKRWFTFDGDRLTLRIKPGEVPGTSESELVWERVREGGRQ
ncbi:MAG TPA: lipocalin-like domain-containing protein [Vicinamibacterales bacterium]|nr:lipocalin-like domain-containing protein [Vicinamibacterales bacterium]